MLLEKVVLALFGLVVGTCGGVALAARVGAVEHVVRHEPEVGRLDTCERALKEAERQKWDALEREQDCAGECLRLVQSAREQERGRKCEPARGEAL